MLLRQHCIFRMYNEWSYSKNAKNKLVCNRNRILFVLLFLVFIVIVYVSHKVYLVYFLDIPQWPIEHNYESHIQLMDTKERKGCVKKPFMQINANYCPPDILHMKKGIISKLMNQVVDWVILQGKEDKLMSQMKKHRIPFT